MSDDQPTTPEPIVSLDDEQLAEIRRSTVGHYDRSAPSFWEGTKDHDVSQNLDALLRHIEATPPFRILDFGCGPGRDLAELRRRGHEPTGLDGARQFVEMARRLARCEVLHQDFLELDLPDEHFHGVFANASLFHVPSCQLSRVLGELRDALTPRGVLFSSNPRGRNVEGWSGQRWGSYVDYHRWRTMMEVSGFTELEHYFRPPGRPRDQQPWLASVWRKV